MDDFRRFPVGNTRQLIDYNRFISLTGTKLFICLDQGVMEIARYFLNSRGQWKTTYYTELSEAGYTTPTNEQMEQISQAIAEANIDMSNCEEINNSLQGIIGAIEGLQGGSGGCGCIADPGSNVEDFNDAPSQDIPGDGDPLPPGFATQEEYDEYRCNAAQWLYDNYTATLRNWAGLFGTLGGLTLAVISGLLLLTVPPIGLSLILAALGVIVGIDIGLLATLSDIAGFMDDNEEETVCNLYNAPTTSQAQSVLQEAAQTVIVSMGLGALQSTFEQITANLISIEQCEVLFNNSDLGGTVGDCSSCSGAALATIGDFGCIATITSGNFASAVPTTVESCTSTVFGTSRANMLIGSTASPTNRLFEVTGVSGNNGGMILNWSQGGVVQTQQDWPELDDLIGLSWTATELHFIRNTGGDNTVPFELTFEVTEV